MLEQLADACGPFSRIASWEHVVDNILTSQTIRGLENKPGLWMLRSFLTLILSNKIPIVSFSSMLYLSHLRLVFGEQA
jgi:hypothetical protein